MNVRKSVVIHRDFPHAPHADGGRDRGWRTHSKPGAPQSRRGRLYANPTRAVVRLP